MQQENLEIIKKFISDDWKNFQEGSALYIFLSLSHNFIQWKILKEVLSNLRDNQSHQQRQENAYKEMIEEIYKNTLLTYGE